MTLSFAYKYFAMMLMVSEANFFCGKTGLSPGRLFTESDVRPGSHVGPLNSTNFSGSIITDQYFFGYWQGHLANFRSRDFMPQDSDKAIQERNRELSKYSSLIDTNGAYQLATNWLAALGVDVAALERKYRLNFIQWRYYPAGKNGPVIMLPVYTVEWRGFILRTQPNRESAVVTVTVFGATKELVEYHVLDNSLFLRPRIQIKDAEKLLSIPDEEFRSFDAVQRSNLVAQFTARGEGAPAFPLTGSVPTKGTNQPVRDKTAPKLPGSQGAIRFPTSEVHKLAPTPSQPTKREPPK